MKKVTRESAKKGTIRKTGPGNQGHSQTNMKVKLLPYMIRKAYLVSAGMLLAQSFHTGVALANPQDGQITGGQGSIQQVSPDLTLIQQQSNSLAIDWPKFNVDVQQTVRFEQPSASSAVLNRILDQNPSQILGTIKANGRVFLINPNGLIFGATAQVSVGSLVASSLALSTSDFMQGRYNLSAMPGQEGGLVVNRGLIEAAAGGSVTLVGGAVANEGVIIANAGKVNLAAGHTATLDFDGDGLLRFEVGEQVLENALALEDAVRNSGQIIANGGEVLLTAAAAKDVFTQVVNNEGIIQAGRIDNTGGVVRLVGTGGTVFHSGSIDASGQDAVSTGGTVQILGDKVGLIGGASIDASGATGGGTVLVGGDYQGSNPDIQNASRTYVGADASIKADATDAGDGGKVIVWADEATGFNGSASVRGGAQSGDGGFIEVSGKQSLIYDGRLDAGTTNGQVGTVLFDPDDIVVSIAGTGNGAGEEGASLGDVLFAEAVTTAGWDVTPAQLDAVVGAIVLQAHNDVTFTDAVDLTGSGTATTLTVQAGDDILINANITTNNGAVNFTANDASGNQTGIGTAGVITMADGTTINAGNQNITLSAEGNITLENLTTTGDVSVTSTAGSIVEEATGNDGLISATNLTLIANAAAQTIGATGAGAMNTTLSGTLTASANTGAGGIFVTETNAMSIVTVDSGTGAVILTATTGDIALANNAINAGSGTVTVVATAGDITVAATGTADITTTGTVNLTGGAIGATNTLDIDGATALNINDTGAGAISISEITASTIASTILTVADATSGNIDIAYFGGDVVNINDGHIFDTTTLDHAFSYTATAGNITDINTVTLGSTGSFTTSAANATIDMGTLAVTGDIDVHTNGATGNASIVNSIATQLAASAVGGNLVATATTGNMTDSGTVTVGGTATFTTTALNATIDMGTLAVTGDIDVNTNGATGNASIVNSIATQLAASAVGGNLVATATTGNLTDSGTVTVGGTASLTTSAANADIDMGTLAVTGDIDVHTNGATGNASIVNGTAVQLATSGVGGNLVATATTGNMTDSGTVTVGGTATLTTTAVNATIDMGTLAVTGAIGVNTNGATADASIVNSIATILGASSVGRNLVATASTGDITNNGALIVVGNSTFTALTTRSIAVDNASNSFGGTVTFVGSGGNLASVSVADTTALDLQAMTLTGNLSATGAGLTDSGALVIGGTSTFNAGTNTILLDTAGNDFTGAVSLNNSGANNVAVTDTNAIDLGASSVGGDLAVTAGGDITDSGALTVVGNSTFTAPTTNSITLDTAGNNFTGTVTFVGAGGDLANVTIVDSTALDLQALTLTGNLSATGGSLTVSGVQNVAGTVALNTGGTLTQNANVTSTGASNTIVATAGTGIAMGAAVVTTSNNGDITYTSSTGDITLGHLNAGTAKVTVTATTGSILNGNTSSTNVTGGNSDLTAGFKIGESQSDPITLAITASGTINLVSAVTAYINNLNGATVTSTSGFFDVFGSALASFNAAQKTGLENVGFVDWSLFSEDLSLFGVVEPGIRLPRDQMEDEQAMFLPKPDVPVLLHTRKGWEYLWAFRETGQTGRLKLKIPDRSNQI